MQYLLVHGCPEWAAITSEETCLIYEGAQLYRAQVDLFARS
ncbi:hypothetical protein SAMN04488056_12422 [Cohaesibacter marisflavi]|uniref:Uncharacterized protein n=1 Tax=Cohaesibacter marisflavi TaxID=655353 RepID=A0A1I5MZ58_9HYPH|nr:hypothetical protein SAMN04488056_12422 [Cohaesibacter marisflavi]